MTQLPEIQHPDFPIGLSSAGASYLPRRRQTDLLAEALCSARRLGRAILVSRTVPVAAAVDPLRFFAWGRAELGRGLYWSRPAEGLTMASAGSAWSRPLAGTARFKTAAAAWRAVLEGALIESDPAAPGSGPVCFGGFAFDCCRQSGTDWHGFPDGLLLLPRFLLTQRGGARWLTCNQIVQPESGLQALHREGEAWRTALSENAATGTPSRQSPADARAAPPTAEPSFREPVSAAIWQAGVTAVQQELDGATERPLRKVVLARQRTLTAAATLDPVPALRTLEETYPECVSFAFADRERCFLGATPELLAQLQEGSVRTAALAGTAARGGTAEQDEQLAAGLLASAKERSEHELVVRGLTEGLTAANVQLDPIGETAVVRLRNVQHLYTLITGRLAGDAGILELVGALHPTPAVGGYPTQAALQSIREHEALDRGWYAGPVGWLDGNGNGEFVVAIRSARLAGAEAALFAGCGIVKDSDPAREYEESCLKLRPMLTALGAGDSSASPATDAQQSAAGPRRSVAHHR